MAYRTAFLLSGDEQREGLYWQMLEEQNRRRLKTYPVLRTYPPERPIVNCSPWQSQRSFRLLFENETDPDLKTIYRQVPDEEARLALPRIASWWEVLDEPERLERATVAQGTHGRQPQMLATAMYAEETEILREASSEGLEVLTTTHMTRPHHCGATKCAEAAYWQ